MALAARDEDARKIRNATSKSLGGTMMLPALKLDPSQVAGKSDC
jgi:hypothetical protein